jgi:hypothetical protein
MLEEKPSALYEKVSRHLRNKSSRDSRRNNRAESPNTLGKEGFLRYFAEVDVANISVAGRHPENGKQRHRLPQRINAREEAAHMWNIRACRRTCATMPADVQHGTYCQSNHTPI